MYVAALVASGTKSKREKLDEQGYKVMTTNVRDRADGFQDDQGADTSSVANYTLIGYCAEQNIPHFVLDPPRGKHHRIALVIFTEADEEGELQVHNSNMSSRRMW